MKQVEHEDYDPDGTPPPPQVPWVAMNYHEPTSERSPEWLLASTLERLRRESYRAHRKHSANGMSLLTDEMPDSLRLAALGEEYGEVCRALTRDNWRGVDHLVDELIQLANVATSWAQYLIVNGMRSPEPLPSEGSSRDDEETR